jgi:hypothetical protein
MSRAADSSEKGLTLTEMVIVTVLATVVMLGLTGFYLSSQFTWMDGSTKAIAQREGTFVLETMRDSVHAAYVYVVTPASYQLELYKKAELIPFYVFRWDPSNQDSAFLAGRPGLEAPMIQSRVRRFDLAFVDSNVVELSAFEVVSPTGQTAWFTSSFALLNRMGATP